MTYPPRDPAEHDEPVDLAQAVGEWAAAQPGAPLSAPLSNSGIEHGDDEPEKYDWRWQADRAEHERELGR